MWTRSIGVWTRQGNKLVGSGGLNNLFNSSEIQGRAVALSSDGNTLIAGGLGDNSYEGAAWTFTQPATAILAQESSHHVKNSGFKIHMGVLGGLQLEQGSLLSKLL